jgi:hypothetical protein
MAFTNTTAKSDKLSKVGLGQPVGAHCNTGLAGLAMSYTIAGQTSYAVCNTGLANLTFTYTPALK